MSASHSPSCTCSSCKDVQIVRDQLEQLGGRKRLEARLLRNTAKVLLDEAAKADGDAQTSADIARKSAHPEVKSAARQSVAENTDKRDGLEEEAQAAFAASAKADSVARESAKHLEAIAASTSVAPRMSVSAPRGSVSASRVSAPRASVSAPHFVYADTGSVISTVTSMDDDDDDDDDEDGEDHSIGDDSVVTDSTVSSYAPYAPHASARSSARFYARSFVSDGSDATDVTDVTDATDASSIFAPRRSSHSQLAPSRLSGRSHVTAFQPHMDTISGISDGTDGTDSVVSEHAGGRFYRRRYW
jgi:hypothetical protein